MSDALQQFLQIGVVGVGLSFAVQFIKNKFGVDSNKTKLMTIGLAVLLGGAYFALVHTALWLPVIGILGAASTFYALFLK